MISLNLVRLAQRKLLRISGPDCYPYLQSLISNDLRHLYEPDRIPKRNHVNFTSSVISTFMLNAQGRSICDLMIYRTPSTRYECQFTPPGKATEPDELLIECDAELANGLANTLYGYRIRRKIEISIRDDLSLWSLFPRMVQDEIIEEGGRITSEGQDLKKLIALKPLESTEIISDNLTVVNDPRLVSMGMRIISKEISFNAIKKSLQSMIDMDIIESTKKEYTKHRYILGLGEGLKDHPESNCLPLECNADLLGSVSFTKGCYLGQELTARIHHTGVVRKRLVPISFDLNSLKQSIEKAAFIGGTDIVDGDTGKKVGYLRHSVDDRGLALLRYEMALNSKNLLHKSTLVKIETYKPFWWTV